MWAFKRGMQRKHGHRWAELGASVSDRPQNCTLPTCRIKKSWIRRRGTKNHERVFVSWDTGLGAPGNVFKCCFSTRGAGNSLYFKWKLGFPQLLSLKRFGLGGVTSWHLQPTWKFGRFLPFIKGTMSTRETTRIELRNWGKIQGSTTEELNIFEGYQVYSIPPTS